MATSQSVRTSLPQSIAAPIVTTSLSFVAFHLTGKQTKLRSSLSVRAANSSIDPHNEWFLQLAITYFLQLVNAPHSLLGTSQLVPYYCIPEQGPMYSFQKMKI